MISLGKNAFRRCFCGQNGPIQVMLILSKRAVGGFNSSCYRLSSKASVNHGAGADQSAIRLQVVPKADCAGTKSIRWSGCLGDPIGRYRMFQREFRQFGVQFFLGLHVVIEKELTRDEGRRQQNVGFLELSGE